MTGIARFTTVVVLVLAAVACANPTGPSAAAVHSPNSNAPAAATDCTGGGTMGSGNLC